VGLKCQLVNENDIPGSDTVHQWRTGWAGKIKKQMHGFYGVEILDAVGGLVASNQFDLVLPSLQSASTADSGTPSRTVPSTLPVQY